MPRVLSLGATRARAHGPRGSGKKRLTFAVAAGRQVCNVAPIPGETKIWQYITLMKRVFLIDCPGVVYHVAHDTNEDEMDTVLKGVARTRETAKTAPPPQKNHDWCGGCARGDAMSFAGPQLAAGPALP